MVNHMTIGQRASLAIKRRVRFGNVKPELDRLTIPHSSYERWKLGKGDPQGYWLQQMALAGYAALKYRRTLSNANPTPVGRREAENKLLEEIADVKLCLHVAGFEAVRHKIQVNRTITEKAERWLKRLMERR